MLSSVLRSERAVEINIQVIRAFVKIRQLVVSNSELANRLNHLEQRYDSQFSCTRATFSVTVGNLRLSSPGKKGVVSFKK